MKTEFRKYDNVRLGEGANVGDYVILGLPSAAREGAGLVTIIGNNALIRSHTVIYAGNEIGSSFQTGHNVMVREDNRIGDNVSIGTGSVVEHHVTIEDDVRIHSQAFIPEYSILKKGCWIGPNVVLTNALHPLCPKVKDCLKGPTIGRNSKIGANVTILPDVTVGESALVGSGSVVTKDVPAGVVVAGNPAKVIKRVDELTCPYELIDRPYE
ncbi:MAG: acyltransferase [bacterium]|nr:acyltransferase [bacterium]